MLVPFLELASQNSAIGERLLSAMSRVLGSGRYILGPEVERFEEAVARYLGVGHAIGCSSGSDALVVALLSAGVGEGDEVVTTPFSFFATVESIVRVGARPIFVDVGDESLEIEPESVARAITPRTRAILGVHLYGAPFRAEELAALAAANDVVLIEDVAQAFGSRLGSRAAGSIGALGCFSFQPTKPLGALGDAGLVVTSDLGLAERCRRLVLHGKDARHRHQHQEIGGNYRLDALQAAVLYEKLESLPSWLAARKTYADAYSGGLAGLPELGLPALRPNADSNHALYTLRVMGGRRDELLTFLGFHGVETAVYYPEPLHRQPALLARGLGLKWGAMPTAERASTEVLSLPLYPELGMGRLEYVVARVREFFGR